MRHLQIPTLVFHELGRNPSAEFPDPDSNANGTRRVAQTESGLWLALRCGGGIQTLTAYRTEKAARYVPEEKGEVPTPHFLRVWAGPASTGELADAHGTALSVEIVRGEVTSLEMCAHSPEFQLALDCFVTVAKLRGGIAVSPAKIGE